MSATRKFWGWGIEGHVVPKETLSFAEASLGALLGAELVRREPPRVRDVPLAEPRFVLPSSLARLGSSTPFDRLNHALGKSYRDIARAIARHVPHAPDVVAFPESEADVVNLIDHAAHEGIAVVPYGGGSSVAGGVEPKCDGFERVMSLDLTKLHRLEEIDATSRAARIQGGALGPRVEEQLRPHGLTLRHFPQSFEFSTLGGWIATRAGGHYATLATHIDDLVEAIRVVTPSGVVATRRLPGSGAGPQPERLFMGSEGTLGIITEAWVRVVPRPTYRASATVKFDSFDRGLEALRQVSQSGLYPTNARLLDPAEAMVSGSGAGDAALLLLAFESADHALEAWIRRAVDIARGAGGRCPDEKIKASHTPSEARDETADTYKKLFLEAPYLRDEIILRGAFVETYETATTWSHVRAMDAKVREGVSRALAGKPHVLATRVTHAYPDGCAPYYTLICAAHPTDPDAQWFELKAAITDAIVDAGGTSTHHHAVGRDVVPYFAKERDPLFAQALGAVKKSLDPRGIMNPGALL